MIFNLYYLHRTTHNHWLLIEEGGWGWDRMAVTLFSQKAAQLLTYKCHVTARLKSGKNFC